ncbi:MAG TPA: hypothetical protein VI197_30140 [Polyangiaceae bacterium]
MSAFVCSDTHLAVLASYAVRNCLEDVPYALRTELERDGFEHKPGGYMRTVARVASMLARENLLSIEDRYPGDHSGEHEAYETFTISKVAETRARELPALTIIKACHCYAYQACEHPGWEASDARKLTNAIEAHAVRHLPGYDAAPWGL